MEKHLLQELELILRGSRFRVQGVGFGVKGGGRGVEQLDFILRASADTAGAGRVILQCKTIGKDKSDVLAGWHGQLSWKERFEVF